MNSFYEEKIDTKYLFLLITIAYAFSFAIRMIWIFQFSDNPNFIWNNELMISTNDGYFFAAGVQKELMGLNMDNPRIPSLWSYGMVFFTTIFVKFTPFSLETIILYMPSFISSLVVIPIILIARLYKQTLLGFLSALLASIAWSYYNRTMVGYYDTDMFSAMAPMIILFFLMKSSLEFSLKSALFASISIIIYPFLYDQGQLIIYAMAIMYALYILFYHSKEKLAYQSLILIFLPLLPIPFYISMPYILFIKILVVTIIYFTLQKVELDKKKTVIISAIVLFLFLIFSNVLTLLIAKVTGYTSTGTSTAGLHFYGVAQTVREAGHIPFSMFAKRISGSQVGVVLSLIGYILLVVRYRAFILALPLIGIGVFSLIGGLRFTVYAVPIAGISAIFLFFVISEFIKDRFSKYAFILLATGLMIYPNITHIIGYKVPTVLNKTEVTDLDKLKKISTNKDYTLTWWDYGYPIWFFSDTSTLIDGGKHHNDNFIISQLMLTSSSQFAYNLARLSVETYVSSNYKIVANTLFKNGQKDQLNPNDFLFTLEDKNYKLPPKTRDIYLYMPYRMLNIFPTVAIFGNLDLMTGKQKRRVVFYPTQAIKKEKSMISLQNGIKFDTQKGKLYLGSQVKKVKYFIMTQNTKSSKIKLQSQLYNIDGEYAVIFMRSYGRFIVMDIETFKSMYVQMFILGLYDKNLFDLVVSSAYSRIYKLK